MNRSLLTPRWLLLHLLFVVAVLATVVLAWWQWDRAHDAGGSFQNLGYALQWPLFGAFAVFLWIRVARMSIHEQRGTGGPEQAVSEATALVTEAEETGRKRPLVPPPAPPVEPEEDPELAAYNRYLAELNENGQQR